jgi:hypothetical protein
MCLFDDSRNQHKENESPEISKQEIGKAICTFVE